MSHEAHPSLFAAFVASSLAAIPAFGTALAAAAAGQGLGAMAGGCSWIGISLPVHRQVWALVNQPTLNFASTAGAGGYWLGSLAVPMVMALMLFSLRTRRPTISGQLYVVQSLWWTAVIAGAWLPLLDPDDGHLSRWVALHRFPDWVVWAAPAAAVAVALLAVFRLLEISRSLHGGSSRASRVLLVLCHLLLPVSAWLGVVTLVGGPPPWRPLVGVGLLSSSAVVFAWLRYPPASPRQPGGLTAAGFASLAVGIVITVSVLWWGGRALDGERVSGMLWASPESFNNIRTWIVPNHGTTRRGPDG